MSKWNLKLAWTISGVAVLAFGALQYQGRTAFEGYVDETRINITAQNSGLVKRILVKTGDKIVIGQPLVELEDANIDLKINKLERQDQRLKTILSTVTTKNDGTTGNDKESNKGTKKKQRLMGSAAEARKIEEAIDLQKHRRRSMTIQASNAGIVGDISAQEGDYLKAHQQALVVYESPSTTAHGFLEERKNAALAIAAGDEVLVRSSISPDKVGKGRIKSVGERYVQIPLRLVQNNIGLSKSEGPWGREVIIEITDGTAFLAQERISIFTTGESALHGQKNLFNVVLGILGIRINRPA